MAPEKRTRRVVEEDDVDDDTEDGAVVTPASGQESSRKRVRVSDAIGKRPASPSSPTQENEESDDDHPPAARAPSPDATDSPPRTQYEIYRDQDYSHLRHEAEDDMRATQKVLNSSRVDGQADNHAAANGIIETVTCFNFMCHTRLCVELGPLLNFIVGENGSGKSAVLTAITLCLGAKASSTNRGGSLKSFIKEGQEQSTIQVKLKNQGEGAYQPEQYGESIIVERHFSKNGTSGFKLKSALGRLISTKRRDVDELVEYFCLQMDNPLNVLSQDNARQFLNASSPALKYKFFVQGVQLEALDNDYKLVMQTADNIEAKLESAADYVKRLEGEHRDAKRDLDTLRKNEALREKRRLYRNQLIWAQVVEAERVLKKADQAIVAADERLARAEGKIHEQSQILEVADESLRQAELSIQAITADAEALEAQEKAAKDAYLGAKAELSALHNEERTARDRWKNAQEDVKSLERRITEEERRLAEATGDGRATKEAELKAANEEVQRLSIEIEQIGRKLPDDQRRLDDAKKAMYGLKDALNGKKAEIRAVEKRIHDLQQNRGSDFGAFDPNIQRLLKMIDDDRGFERKPIGPIGRHIRLLKPEWSSIIERLLGSSPSAFIAIGPRDAARLRNLMKRAGVRNTPVLISNGRKLDLTGKEPDPRYDTILRVLQFEDDLIRDQLIIHHKIEQALLIGSRTDAEKAIFSDRPRNVAFGLCHHDKKKGEGISLVVNGRGDQSLDPVRPYVGAPRLRSDDEAQIRHQRSILEHLKEELRDIQRQLEDAGTRVDECQGALRTQSARRQQFEKTRRIAQANADNLEAELDRFEGGDIELTNLKESLGQAEARVKHEGEQYGDMVVRKPELNRKCEELQRAMKEASANVAQVKVRLDDAGRKLANKADSRRLALSAKNEAFEERDQARLARDRAVRDRDKVRSRVEGLDQQARENAGERVYIAEDATFKSIEAKYQTIVAQLEKIERRLGASEEEITERAEKAQASYETAMREHENQLQLQQELKQALAERLKRWRSFQRFLSARTRVNFNYLLSERGFRGRMLIDHRSRRLALQVEPDETRRVGGGRETKTLSGGEKSFASICMLLSIWEAMGSSIRCLDEFDVFMDNINRAISTNMLITAARRSVSRQYILITPNAIEGRASLSRDVKIIRYRGTLIFQSELYFEETLTFQQSLGSPPANPT
ncbi:hypothetical protein jhhlp_005675 [Lomentospora prolificans]|uniref:RecF/RecN/SMC N-terminal domain-containing protein n=1 Tax=Lomentospora prolificans TaxID=41688 RepID=A0A2N3N3S9_9PEZI|nr:hypothetical protein jhhlp_005675 [Lomentospora prolificans]